MPHRIINKTSIYLVRQCRVDREDFLGYEAVVALEDNQSITVRSGVQLTPKDGRVFEYILSQWFATKKSQKDLQEMLIEIPMIIEALGQSNRTENRKKIIRYLKNMISVTIIYKWNGGEILFHMLESVQIIDGTNTVSIRVSETYEKALEPMKKRYINVTKAMLIKSSYAIELLRLLQVKGAGVGRNGDPHMPRNISHSDICNYLHLEDGTKKSIDEVRRAFKELENIGCASYSYSGNQKLWKKIENPQIHNS